MKTNKFGLVSSVMSLLAIILTFAVDFIKVTPFAHPALGVKIGENVTAWNMFTGGDEFVAKGIQNESSAGIFILIAVILLAVNILVQFVKPALGKLANTVVSIATAIIYLVVGIMVCASDKLVMFKPEMTIFAYVIIVLCVAMLFVPKMLAKK